MMLVIPNSLGGFLFVPRNLVNVREHSRQTKCNVSRTQECSFPILAFVNRFSEYERHHKSRIEKLSATATEEANSLSLDANSGEASEILSSEIKKSEISSTPAQTTRSRARRSEMPPVKNEELLPGAEFTGKVRSIQPFGAFIDFGAFTDGLVHVSQLSDSYVKDVESAVSIGQEVKVRLVEANMETGRISLSMRENNDSGLKQQEDAASRSDKPRPSRRSGSKPSQRRDEMSKASKFFQGQILEGTVKNLAQAGAFISLPDGDEGFLPTSEESDEGFESMMGVSSLQVGQEVSVRVLRMTRGKVTLTMKKEEDGQISNTQITQGVVHVATNPFLVAFRKNKEIATYLDERAIVEKEGQKSVQTSEAIKDGPAMEENVRSEAKDSESLVDGPKESIKDALQTMEKEAESLEEMVPEGTEPPASQLTEEALQ